MTFIYDSSLYVVRSIDCVSVESVSSFLLRKYIIAIINGREKERERHLLRYNAKGHRSMNPIQSHARRDLRATIWAARPQKQKPNAIINSDRFLTMVDLVRVVPLRTVHLT